VKVQAFNELDVLLGIVETIKKKGCLILVSCPVCANYYNYYLLSQLSLRLQLTRLIPALAAALAWCSGDEYGGGSPSASEASFLCPSIFYATYSYLNSDNRSTCLGTNTELSSRRNDGSWLTPKAWLCSGSDWLLPTYAIYCQRAAAPVLLSHAVGAQHTLAHGCWRLMLIVTRRTCLGYIDVLPSMFFSLPAFYGDDIDFPQRRTVFTWVCASAPDLVSQFSHEEDHVIADCRLSFVLSQYSN